MREFLMMAEYHHFSYAYVFLISKYFLNPLTENKNRDEKNRLKILSGSGDIRVYILRFRI